MLRIDSSPSTLIPGFPMVSWIERLAAALDRSEAFRGCALRAARAEDRAFLFALHRSAMKGYVEATWGWDEEWQRRHFEQTYAPARHAVVVRHGEPVRDIGRISLTRHWRKIFLRDIELIPGERNHGLGGALIGALLGLARSERRAVELVVLKCNPAQRLYRRLGFEVIGDDGERLTMRMK
ncbi:MAG TPA: GNAT family N-acetyltransferase [Casimicrobiaceae bacterium]|nr:GNAT family N-acetyltransferase [Casimicrobiaceae bacterium]